jgi:hypothetical protein
MTAILRPRDERVRAALPARRVLTPDSMAPTPLFTRHMLGAIEADRARRRVFRDTHPRPRHHANETAHPRIVAAVAARARLVSQTREALSRWVDEGGRFDPGVAVRPRNGRQGMTRRSS